MDATLAAAAFDDIEPEEIRIGPQPGPQTAFLETTADLAFYGGAAGGGKSYGLLLEPLRHFDNPRFGGVIFRRNSKQVRVEGGLWDESAKLYPLLGAVPREFALEWKMPSGSRLSFAHLEYDKDVYSWQGAQIAYIGFDELTHFTEFQFFYMLSRNRSSSGVPGYVRGSCNPDADSWVAKFISWYIGEDGLAIPERSGVIRWFIRVDETIMWGDSAEELKDKFGSHHLPKSFTFIPSKITDNKILMEKDPAYIGNLSALSRVERERLLNGNWKIRASAGNVFQAQWFPVINAIPAGWISVMRFWDRAATKPSESNRDPDWTRGILLYRYPDGSWVVGDLKSIRDTPLEVERLVRTTASHDGPTVRIRSQQDPGSAGVAEAGAFIRMLQGYMVDTVVISKDKETRARPASAQAEAGNIRVLRAPWNAEFFSELENFPEGAHDDIVDVLSGAFNSLAEGGQSLLDVL